MHRVNSVLEATIISALADSQSNTACVCALEIPVYPERLDNGSRL